VDKTLDFMCQQLEQLKVVDSLLPDDIEKGESAINRAMDIRSACMRYLAVNIRHDTTPLGIVGAASLQTLVDCLR